MNAVTSRVTALLQAAVDRDDVPLVVGVAADDRGTICEAAAAADGLDTPDVDSVFRIASMTKIVCTVAALQQRDRGDLNLDEPVDSFVPDFADVPVLTGFDGDQPRLRPAATRATVRQLLTHTCGLGYAFWDADLHRWHSSDRTGLLPEGLQGVFAAPMVADPGTGFRYGTGTDWLGRVVETIGGRPLDVLLDNAVFGPLDMRSTGFRVEDSSRLVPVYRRGETGHWRATGFDWDPRPRWWPAGHGLYSTPRDFLRFQRMLLGAGSLDGVRILEPATVAEMFRPQIGRLTVPAYIPTAEPQTSCDFRPGVGATWGWGLLLNSIAEPGLRAAGSGSWGGVFNTYFWVDPKTTVAAALYSQYGPYLDRGALKAYDDFERSVYEGRRS